MATYQLIVRRGPKAGETIPLEDTNVLVGRDPTADIHLNDPEVSRSHCRFSLANGYSVQDLGSTNGTFVDGKRLAGDLFDLKDGNVIQLGSNVTLLYHAIDDDPLQTLIASPDELMAMIDEEEEEEDENATALFNVDEVDSFMGAVAAESPFKPAPQKSPFGSFEEFETPMENEIPSFEFEDEGPEEVVTADDISVDEISAHFEAISPPPQPAPQEPHFAPTPPDEPEIVPKSEESRLFDPVVDRSKRRPSQGARPSQGRRPSQGFRPSNMPPSQSKRPSQGRRPSQGSRPAELSKSSGSNWRSWLLGDNEQEDRRTYIIIGLVIVILLLCICCVLLVAVTIFLQDANLSGFQGAITPLVNLGTVV